MKRRFFKLQVAAATAALLFTAVWLAVFYASWTSSEAQVVITVPTGYRGAIYIEENEQGANIATANRRTDFLIPRTGRLLVSDASPLSEWHQESFRFADGTPIPKGHAAGQHQDGEILAFALGASARADSHDGLFVWFIGTQKECESFRQRAHSSATWSTPDQATRE